MTKQELIVPNEMVVLAIPGEVTATGLRLNDDLTYEQWELVGAGLTSCGQSIQWWLGDWMNYGERKWGEKYAQAIEVTGLDYGTLRNAKYVAGRFDLSCRHDKLSFTHHQEVAALERAQANSLLNEAESEGWSQKELRSRVLQHKNAAKSGAVHRSDKNGRVEDLQALAASGWRAGTVYADPPWRYDNQGTRAATGNHYDGMSIEEICALPVKDLVADDAHLHLWTTNGFLFECPKIFEAWGFEFRSTFIWVKPQIGIGNYWRNSHEILLTAVRGDAKRFADKSLRSWVECERGLHSSKPEQVRGVLERASPPPYIELFARREAPNWKVWGNQIESSLFDQDNNGEI